MIKHLFFGDIGRDDDVLMFPPTKPKMADYVFLESTYGNKLHPDTDKLELETAINSTFQKKNSYYSSFAVERAENYVSFVVTK
jgi:metallo-beta-lactamase family protein